MDKLVFNPAATIREQGLVRQRLVHELVNTATVGFKRDFELALRSVKVDGGGFDTRHQAQGISSDRVLMTPGPLMVTGRHLDIAMEKEAVMVVRATNGELAFTRRGDLRIATDGTTLVTGSGHIVQGRDGPVRVPPGFRIRISPDGTVFGADPAQPGAEPNQEVDRIALRDASRTPLSRRVDGLFQVAGQPPGTDIVNGPEPPMLTPQALEGSNMNPVEAMTRLIDHARSFEAQIRVVKEMKDIDVSGASMMKPV